MAQQVKVVEYDPEWEQLYQQEKRKLEDILDDELVEIHHIGSTAVPGLRAKPIIDIMPVVSCIHRVDLYNSLFEKIGYECMGEFGIPGRRYFRKGGDIRTHQIHIFEKANQSDMIRHLAVRDYLRNHEKARREYGELKSRLAAQYPDSIEKYCDGKDDFVKKLEREAVRWYADADHSR